MADWPQSLRARYPELEGLIVHVQKNPQMWLACVLFCVGLVATALHISTLAGALFGSGAALLGAWITELNNRRSATEDKVRRQSEARQHLSSELYRTINRVLYINQRAVPNFICASADSEVKPNDIKEDFIPYSPILYPNAPQFRDLPGDQASALIAFYDSLHSLTEFVNDWWQREGQLPVNIFLPVMNQSGESLKLALVCVRKFDLEKLFPPPYASWGTITSRIEGSLAGAAVALEHHMARAKANAATSKNISPLPLRP